MSNKHILTVDFHNKATFINANKTTNQEQTQEKEERFLYMKRLNPLFWTFYVLKNGFESIEYPHATGFENEQVVKMECIEKLRESKSTLKQNNISNVKGDVEGDLLNSDHINLKTFAALCISHDISIIILIKNMCYVPKTQHSISGANIIEISFSEENKMVVGINTHMLSEDEIKYNKYYQYNNIDAPIKPMGSYKLPELIDLFTQLQLNKNNDIKWRKIDYYNTIKEYVLY